MKSEGNHNIFGVCMYHTVTYKNRQWTVLCTEIDRSREYDPETVFEAGSLDVSPLPRAAANVVATTTRSRILLFLLIIHLLLKLKTQKSSVLMYRGYICYVRFGSAKPLEHNCLIILLRLYSLCTMYIVSMQCVPRCARILVYE